MSRDSQRSRVYAWERSIPGLRLSAGTLTIEEAEEMVRRVWRSERGRYGLAKRPPPAVKPGRGGGLAFGSHLIKLGRWARQPLVVLHELAHSLTPGDAGHGPRFVGVAIGLYARHLGVDRDELLAAAYERGVRVDLRSIGAVPEFGWHRRALRALERLGGSVANDVELAVEMGVGYRVVRGALLSLDRAGKIVRRGSRISIKREPPPPPPQPKKERTPSDVPRTARQKAFAIAAEDPRISIDESDWRSLGHIWVTSGYLEERDADPFEGDHIVFSWEEALSRALEYRAALSR